MAHQLDKWFTAAAAAFVLLASPACNRGDDKSAEPKVVELPVPVAATGSAQAGPPEVKRYGAQEQTLAGSVRVTGETVKVYAEADGKGEPISELAKSTLVKRKASLGEYALVEYPTPRGDTDIGWVITTDLASHPEGVAETKKVVETSAVTAEKVGEKKTDDKKAAGEEGAKDVKTATTDTKKTDDRKETTKTAETSKTTDAKKTTDTTTKAAGDTTKTTASTKSSKLPSTKP